MSGAVLTPTNPVTDPVRPPATKYRLIIGDGTNGTTLKQLYVEDSAGAITGLNYTDEQAQDAIGALLADSTQLDFTYNDAGNAETVRFLIPVQVALTATANHVFSLADIGKFYHWSNANAGKTATLPTLSAADNGWQIKIQNTDTTIGANIVVSGAGGETFGETGAATATIKVGCRQTFVWDGNTSSWRFDAGNTNLVKTPSAAPAAGDFAFFADTDGLLLTSAPSIVSTKISDFVEAAQDAVLSVISNSDGSIIATYNDTGNVETITVGVLATDAQHGNRGGGALHAVASTVANGFLAATDKAKLNNLFDTIWWSVLDHGITPSNSDTVNLAAWNTMMSAIPDNMTVFWPPNVSPYKFSDTLAIPAGKHLTQLGAGNQKSIVQTTHASHDIFTCGDWYQTFIGLKFTSSVARTGGSAINSGNNVAISVHDCDFSGMWDGILYTGGANAGNLAIVENCGFTGTLSRGIIMDGQNANAYIDHVTMDGVAGTQVAGIEVNQCGSLLISNTDLIRAQNNLKLNPDSGTKGVFSVYCTNVFFDTSSASSVKFMGAGTTNIQRVKFVNCWFSSSVIGCEFASTAAALPTAIDFVNCDIFANSGRGILANGVQDFGVQNCRISANTTAGIETNASAGSVTRFNIQNTRIGPTAGFGGNGQGILVNAGTYGAYSIQGNDVTGNTSNLNIIDNGTAVTSDQNQVSDNLGHLISGAIATLAAPVAIPITTETLILSGRVPANAVKPGQMFHLNAAVIMAGANVGTWRCRVGAVGTVAGDTVVADIVVTAAGFLNGRSTYDATLVIRSIGGAGTIEGEGHTITSTAANVAAAAQTTAAAATTVAVVTNAPWFIDISYASPTAASTAVQAYIEAL